MPSPRKIAQVWQKFVAWIATNRVGVLLLVLQAVGVAGMFWSRENIDAAYWIWGVVLTAAGIGFVGLKKRSPTSTLDWTLFGSGFLLAVMTGYFVFIK